LARGRSGHRNTHLPGLGGGVVDAGFDAGVVDGEFLEVAEDGEGEAGGPGDDVVVVANFSHEAREVYRIGFPRPGLWKLRLNSDWAGYSEDFADFPSHDVEAVEQDCDGMKWSAEVSVGGYTALIFSQDP